MLLRLPLAAVVVCVAGLCWCVEADGLDRVIVPRDYGVKLCGREFIRAVIFTCGGSRWRRTAPGGSDPFQSSSYSDVSVADNQLTWNHGVELTDSRTPLQMPSSYSLADLLALFGALGDRQPPGNPVPLEGLQLPTLLGKQDPAADWPKPSRRKRSFSLGVAGMCCNQGCTKNDIGRLC
ncbi:prorelaxin H1 [Myripristis murdjan]|uniref:prorelaxin H1 n=1 Tax=Myripristis murdjan TaxID=586833 RepID=UPI0011763A84|nr:relaxin-3-like [Myripristis murdjan]